MATIKDIAKKTGLGLATISKYLNGGNVLDENKIAIEAAIQELGFTVNQFARSLKTSRSRTIGVLIPELSNLFITSIVTVVEDILRKAGYAVLICDCRTNQKQEADAVQFLMQKRVDGIINMPVTQDGSHLAPALLAGIPVVLIDRMIHNLGDNVHAVLVDNVAASAQAVVQLVRAGHTNIGIVVGPADVFTSRQRLLGYAQVLEQNCLAPQTRFVCHSDYTVQGGYESMKYLLAQQGLSAVFVTNYEMTLGGILAVNEAGVKIPDEISLIGFDNLHLAQVIQPKLSIVTQPLDEIGQKAAEILLQQLQKPQQKSTAQVVTLQTSMIAGDSVLQK